MKIVDANVLLYTVNERAVHHRTSQAWLDDALSGIEAIGFSWFALIAFLRVSTHPRLPRALDVDAAGDVARRWLEAAPSVVLHPSPRHLGILRGLLRSSGTAGNLVPDAHLAALAIEHHGEVVTFDTDFARFPGLRWHLPGEARARRNPG